MVRFYARFASKRCVESSILRTYLRILFVCFVFQLVTHRKLNSFSSRSVCRQVQSKFRFGTDSDLWGKSSSAKENKSHDKIVPTLITFSVCTDLKRKCLKKAYHQIQFPSFPALISTRPWCIILRNFKELNFVLDFFCITHHSFLTSRF